MPITKTQAGVLFSELFMGTTLPAGWETVPATPSRYSVGSGLRVHPGGGPAYVLAPMPAEEFLLQGEFRFTPTDPGEHGGLVVFGDAGYQVTVQLYGAEHSPHYEWARIIRRGTSLEAWGRPSLGTPWEFLGSTVWAGPGRVGVYRSGGGVTELEVISLICCRGPALHVGNLKEGTSLELWLTDGEVAAVTGLPGIDGWASLPLDTLAMPITGEMRVVDAEGNVLDRLVISGAVGGDQYWRDLGLELRMGDTPLSPEGMSQLPQMTNGVTLQRMSVVNSTDAPALARLTVGSVYPLEGGVEGDPALSWVKLAADVSGAPGEYMDALDFGEIQVGEERFFWVRVERSPEEWWTVQPGPTNRQFKLLLQG